MTMWARIESGTVAELTDLDPTGRFHPSLTWVACTAEVKAGWLYQDGAFSAPVIPPAPIPQVVTMRQARLAMSRAGILASVESMIAGMTGVEGDEARIEWEFAAEVKRDWPLVVAIGPSLGLTDAQIDDLFVMAATL